MTKIPPLSPSENLEVPQKATAKLSPVGEIQNYPAPRKRKRIYDNDKPPTKEFIRDNCDVYPITGCWVWMGYMTDRGYACFEIKGRNIRVHRLSWELWNGTISPGIEVCHQCDNPICCNPEHLFLGTHRENINNKVEKSRHRLKYTVEQYRAVLEDAGSLIAISKRHGISASQVARIRCGNIICPELWPSNPAPS